MSTSKFEEFLGKVTSKVKSTEAHSMIKKELRHHLEELSSTYQKSEATKEEADKKAIQAMGNPFTIGESLNKIHRPKIDWLLVFLFAIIAGISFLPLLGGIWEIEAPASFLLKRQTTWMILAVVTIICLLLFDYRKLKNLWVYFYVASSTLLLYTNFFGYIINGKVRGIRILGIQIIDITPLSLLLFFLAWAGVISIIHTFNTWRKQFLLAALFWTPILFYISLADVMFCIIYFFCIVTMFAFANMEKRIRQKLIFINIATGMILFSLMLMQTTKQHYYILKLLAFLNPGIHEDGEGNMYHVINEFLAHTGWAGNGFSREMDTLFLPSAHTDFAFLYLTYALGWAFGLSLCIILLLFIGRIAINAFKIYDSYGRLLVLGGTALFAIPACWNILMVFGLVPIMGVSLPFISYGGSMMLFYSSLLGLILSVYRRKDIIEPTLVNIKER